MYVYLYLYLRNKNSDPKMQTPTQILKYLPIDNTTQQLKYL